MQGIIRRLVADKGFGFLQADRGGAEYFFHRSACDIGVFEALEEGQVVTFEEGEGRPGKGPRAEVVEPVTKSAA